MRHVSFFYCLLLRCFWYRLLRLNCHIIMTTKGFPFDIMANSSRSTPRGFSFDELKKKNHDNLKCIPKKKHVIEIIQNEEYVIEFVEVTEIIVGQLEIIKTIFSTITETKTFKHHHHKPTHFH